MSALPLPVASFLLVHRVLRRLERRARWLVGPLRVLASALWLGLLDRDDLAALDQHLYDRDRRYLDPAYNRRGLWPWEERAVSGHFPAAGRLLVTSAGGGREVVALHRLGYHFTGFECNDTLRALADRILAEDALAGEVRPSPRDRCPRGRPPYDGAVVGWGAYTLIGGRAARVAYLVDLARQLRPGAPVLLSFFARPADDRWFRRTARLAAPLARWRGVEAPALGDVLDPNFQHYFARAELEDELRAAGLEPVAFTTEDYAHAVGRVAGRAHPPPPSAP